MPADFVTRSSLGATGDSIPEVIVRSEGVARTSLRILGLVVLFLLPSQAQIWAATGGTISGTVADPTGAVVPGAGLKLVNTAQREVYQATSDQHGFYSFPSLPVGHYDLTITASGCFRSGKEKLGRETWAIGKCAAPVLLRPGN